MTSALIALEETPNGVLQDAAGNALKNHQIYVYLRGTTTQAQLYSDLAGTIPLTQPVYTTATGAIPGYVTAEQLLDFHDATTGQTVASDPVAAQDVATIAAGEGTALQKAANLGDVADPGSSRFNIRVPELLPVQCVATANVASLSGLPTIDGYTLTNNDVALLTAQTTASQNGPWQMPASGTGAWARPTEFPYGGVVKARRVAVINGTTYAKTDWLLSTNASIVIDTNSQTWVQFSTGGGGGGGGGAVSSVFGRTGAVTAQTGDYTPAQVGAEASANKDAASGYAGLDSGVKLKLAEFPGTILTDSAGVNAPLKDVGGTSLVNIPAWQPSTFYPAGFVVQQNGLLYAANSAFTSGASFNAANWTALTAAGTELGYAEITANSSQSGSAVQDVSGLSVTFTATGRPVVLRAKCYSVQQFTFTGTPLLTLTDSANTTLDTSFGSNSPLNAGAFTLPIFLEARLSGLTAGTSYTYKVRGQTTAGTFSVLASTAYKALLRAEQL